MANEEDNVPPTNFQQLDSGVRTRGSEIKVRGTEMAKKAEKKKKRQSPTETSLQPLHTVKINYRKIWASNLPTNYCKIYRKSI